MSISYPRGTVAGFDSTVVQLRPLVEVARGASVGSVVARTASAAQIDSWDALVSTFPGWRVTHTRAWLESLEAAGLGRPLHIVFERAGRVVGCLPGLLSRLGPLRLFGSPLPGWQTVGMGPVFDPAAISTGEIVNSAIPLLEREFGVHHVEIMSSTLDRTAMEGAAFRGAPAPTFSVPLYPAQPERALRGMKDSARRNVKRAVKLGLIVREEHDAEFIAEHFDQITEVFTRGGFAVPFRVRRVQSYVEHMHRAGRLLGLAVYLPDGRTCIATGTFTIAAGEMVLWMWTHRTEHRWFRPTELMTWTAMQRAMDAGCVSLDLMGRGVFKAQLGASADESKVRWVRSRYAWLRSVRDAAEWAYRSQQALRGRISRRFRSLPAIGHGDASASAPSTTAPAVTE